jgi:hypothetical protein
MIDLIERLREALSAGPTPGPWITAGLSFGDPLPRYTTCIVQDTDDDCAPDVVRFMVEERDEQHELDAAYIAAACNAAPFLLAAIERLTAERDSARRDGMSAAASILEAEHEKRSHLDNHAAYYARMIREHIGR